MGVRTNLYPLSRWASARLGLRRWKRDERGANAVEFAILATPFLMFVFGIVGVCYYFFMMNSLEKGIDEASRFIRTGQAQSNDMKIEDFKKKVCSQDGVGTYYSWIKCDHLEIFVKPYDSWEDVRPEPCVDGSGNALSDPTPGGDLISKHVGEENQIVIVTACYRWDLPKNLPYITLGNMEDGSMMMQTATVFRSEPYATNLTQ